MNLVLTVPYLEAGVDTQYFGRTCDADLGQGWSQVTWLWLALMIQVVPAADTY